MKVFLLSLLLISSSAFAKVDFNLSKASEGGNADKLTFSEEKLFAKPENFIGKEIVAPISTCTLMSLKGINLKKEKINYDGVSCYTPNSMIGIILDLKQRDLFVNRKIKMIKGKIVAVSNQSDQPIIIKPEEIN